MGVELLIFVGLQAAVFAVLYVATKAGAHAPLEPVAPPEKPKQVMAYGDEVLLRTATDYGLRHRLDVADGKVGELRVTLRAEPHAAAEAEVLAFTGEAVFDQELDLDLRVHPKGGGAADFESAFDVEALHEDQAEQLFGGELADALVHGKRMGWVPKLDDSGLSIEVPGRQPADTVNQAFAWLIETAGAVLTARRALPRPALEQAVQDAFRTVAGLTGGRVDVNRNELLLETDFGLLRGWLERSGKRSFRTLLGIELERSVPADLHLGLERERSRLARWRHPDLAVGDELFDSTFLIGGESEEAVRALLTEPVRERLLRLVEHVDSFELEPARLRLAKNRPIADADELRALVDRALAAIGAVCPVTPRSAYR